MREAFAHDAILLLAPDADRRAPGAAVTVALCGHWDHEPPCPLAPHVSQGTWQGGALQLRILFAVAPAMEDIVRGHIEAALRGGELRGPDGVLTRWRLHLSRRSDVAGHEADQADQLVHA
jgi:hypothetical protein